MSSEFCGNLLVFFRKFIRMAQGKDFVDRIDTILKQKNRKRIALAEEIGQSVQAFTDWKRRDSIPAADIALKIADYLEVSLEWLISGQESQEVSGIQPDVLALAEDIARLPVEYQNIIRQNVEAYKDLCFKLERESSLGIG